MSGWSAAGRLLAMSALCAGSIAGPPVIRAAVEPGYYFDPGRAAVGDEVHVRAVEVGFCDDASFFLAPPGESVSGPTDAALVAIDGRVLHDEIGDTELVFTVPDVDTGSYLGYVWCDPVFGPTSNELTVAVGTPSSDAVASPRSGDRPVALLFIVGTAGAVLGLLAPRRRRPRPPDPG